MKKLILGLSATLFLVGCGKGFNGGTQSSQTEMSSTEMEELLNDADQATQFDFIDRINNDQVRRIVDLARHFTGQLNSNMNGSQLIGQILQGIQFARDKIPQAEERLGTRTPSQVIPKIDEILSGLQNNQNLQGRILDLIDGLRHQDWD